MQIYGQKRINYSGFWTVSVFTHFFVNNSAVNLENRRLLVSDPVKPILDCHYLHSLCGFCVKSGAHVNAARLGQAPFCRHGEQGARSLNTAAAAALLYGRTRGHRAVHGDRTCGTSPSGSPGGLAGFCSWGWERLTLSWKRLSFQEQRVGEASGFVWSNLKSRSKVPQSVWGVIHLRIKYWSSGNRAVSFSPRVFFFMTAGIWQGKLQRAGFPTCSHSEL